MINSTVYQLTNAVLRVSVEGVVRMAFGRVAETGTVGLAGVAVDIAS